MTTFNLSQAHSVFMPGLTARGPVINSSGGLLGALPAISDPVKFALIAGVLYFGRKQKIPWVALGAAAFGVYQFFPSATAAPVTTNLAPDMTVPTIDPGPMPVMPAIGS